MAMNDPGWRRFLSGAAIGAIVGVFEGGFKSGEKWNWGTMVKGAVVGGMANVVLNEAADTAYEGGSGAISKAKSSIKSSLSSLDALGAYAGPSLPQINTEGDPYQQAAMAGWGPEY